MISNQDIAVRLILSLMMGALVGLEREKTRHPAGLRTHMLVSVGSTLITLASIMIFPADPARIAAGIVTGIGFLGAGTIFRDKNNVRGLTTAASIWVVAGVGMTLGAGLYFLAATSTAAIMLTLFMAKVERKIEKRR